MSDHTLTQEQTQNIPGRFKYASLLEAFWAHCTKGRPDECWPWTGITAHFGHGKLRFRHAQLYAHRASWEVHYGPIPAGLNVLHKCDNPPCCNPHHLFLGTHADNHADMDDKGRGVTRLTKSDVVSIRQQAQLGTPHASIASQFGISRTTVWRIVKRKVWRRVP